MRAFFKKYWFPTIIVIIGIIFAVFLLIAKGQPQTLLPTPQPIKLALIKTFPFEGEIELAFPATAITFTFSTKIDAANIIVEINPVMNYEVSLDTTKKNVYIKPTTAWKLNTSHTITLSVKSEDGQSLSDLKYTFTPRSIKDSPLTE